MTQHTEIMSVSDLAEDVSEWLLHEADADDIEWFVCDWKDLPPDAVDCDGTTDEITIRPTTEQERDRVRRARIAAPDGLNLAKALLLFYSPDWTDEKRKQWKELTGQDEATTRVLGDMARALIAKAEGV